ncbi:MAG TPA: glycoside hydrolase family 38 C-terminal domain-containing protein [Ignavibacteriaceae bacterium]|nr:glycoside hydrolase family 38 C-terminal domain-containing protein [Ignavibacteriaceae bacterium]
MKSFLLINCRISFILIYGLSFFLYRDMKPQTNVDNLTHLIDTLTTYSYDEWKVSPNLKEAKIEGNPYSIDFDDSEWEELKINQPLNFDSCWIRKEIELPDEILGQEVKGKAVLSITADDYGYVWVNGEEKGYFSWDGDFTLTEKAEPGQKFLVAVKIINTANVLRLLRAEINVESAKEVQTKIRDFSLGMKTAQRLLSLETYQTNARVKYDPGIDKSDIPKDERTKLNELLQETADEIDAGVLEYGEADNFLANLQEVRPKLEPIKEFIKRFTLYFDANAHIDAAWLWRKRETVEVCKNTFSSVFNVMQSYPGFTYTQSAAQYYDWMEKIYPDVFQKIVENVYNNRWELSGGMWIEPDCNLIDGVSWDRHLLYAKSYFKAKFGKNVKIGWNPDSFGYNWNMPMFYKNAGINAFITQKIGWNETNVFPYRVFWWESPDGSRILSYFPFDYVNTITQAYQLVDWLRQFEANTGFKKMMVLFGIGDHGGGPTKDMIERIEHLKSLDFFPNVEYGTAEQYLNWLEEKNLASLPVWKDELYLEYHQGTFTTQAKMKKFNRLSEVLLTDAEKFSSIAKLLGGRYLSADLDTAWKYTMFNQFHDILPGSGIGEVYSDAAEDYKDVIESGNYVLQNSLGDLAARINTSAAKIGKEALVIFNPLAWERTDLVTLELDKGDFSEYTILNTNGKQIPSQVLSNGRYGRKIIFIADKVPGLGYKTFAIKKGKAPYIKSSLRASENNLENEFFTVTINPSTGYITSIIDKRNNKEILASGGNELQLLEDKPSAWEAWNLGLTGVKYPLHFDKLEVIEAGPVRAVVRAYFSYLKPGVKKDFPTPNFPSSFIYQDIVLYSGADRIDFKTSVDWHEEKTMLKTAFTVSVKDTSATYEIPYGTIKRSTKRETSWQKARYEVPAIRWADLSDNNYGVSLLNNSKYGYDIKDNVMRLSLLRSPKWPDPNADMGKHEIEYALYPHSGDWKAANTVKKGYEFNTPLIAFRTGIHSGELPTEKSLISINGDNLILTSVKKAQDSDALIIQWYESKGEDTEALINLPKRPKKILESNFLEEDGDKINFSGNSVKVKTGKNSVKTIKVYF